MATHKQKDKTSDSESDNVGSIPTSPAPHPSSRWGFLSSNKVNMDKISLGDINLLDVGNSIQIGGMVWVSNDLSFMTLVPGQEEIEFENLKLMPLSLDEWQKLIRQSDLVETEILANDNGKIKKIIYRKTQRQIDTRVQWAVFARDNYTCRYTGQTGVPLTVDHIDLWEKGGATVVDNLIAVTKSANRKRGNTPYEEWIKSPIYHRISQGLSDEVKQKNIELASRLDYLKTLRRVNERSR